MKGTFRHIIRNCLLIALAVLPLALSACDRPLGEDPGNAGGANGEPDAPQYLMVIEDAPDTVDFQCTTIYYTIATNVFNRLVEMTPNADGEIVVTPSLARAWEVSEDGRVYTFHLRENVRFSNGASLTASDVLYTFTRLLTWPESCNRDIAVVILGAEALENGEAETLEGFQILSDLDFTIALEEPYAAFLACLSMPGASILDEGTTSAAGSQFGREAACTVGTGSFILTEWTPGVGMKLAANPDCWQGAPRCPGVDMRFLTEPEELQILFEKGQLDILDLDDVGNDAEFFIHGDIYQERLFRVPRIGTTYIALNESIEPLNDVRVRKALQLSLNRDMLLKVVYSGFGYMENGIFPHGLNGFNPDLPEIPYDVDAARALLAEAGYPEGIELTAAVKSSSTQSEMTLMRLVVSMWEKAGVKATINVMDEAEFMRLRKSGQLACYSATWTADFDDPDNFIYTFFGTPENTAFRSLCYPNEAIMTRVQQARRITDPAARMAEYHELEKIIVQDDAAWIPLFSRERVYALSERITGVTTTWNGSVKNMYREMSVKSD